MVLYLVTLHKYVDNFMADKKNRWIGTHYGDHIVHGPFIYQSNAMTLMRVGFSGIAITTKYH